MEALETHIEPEQEVKKRIVFYVPGFDPVPVTRYRELYRQEAVKQCAISGHKIQIKRLQTLKNLPRFAIQATIDGKETQSEVRFLSWNRLVHKSMDVPIWRSWLALFKVAYVIAISGSLHRLIRLRFWPNVAGFYPYFMLPAQAGIALLSSWIIGSLFYKISATIGIAFGVLIFHLTMSFFRRRDNIFLAYYVLHDLEFVCRQGGYTPRELRERFEDVKTKIVEACHEGADEVLVVGHSSGAHMAVIILAELVRSGKIKPEHNVSFLTLGQAIPMVSYLPKADDLRLALDELGAQDVVKWVDVSALSDGASFSLCHPVLCSVPQRPEHHLPRVVSAALSLNLSPQYYNKIRGRFFRIHFQYLCHFDRDENYDYFRITSGPDRLWSIYGERKNSPSMSVENLNKYKEMRP